MSSISTLDSRLEERLIRAKVISDDQLSLVRELQQESPLSLAQALVELDLLSAREVERIVESIHEIRFIKLEEMQIDREAVRHVPARVARHHRCIPVRRSGNMLVIAAANPLDVGLRDSLTGVTDCELLILAAEPDAVEHALYLHYSSEGQSGNAMLAASVNAKSEYALDPWEIPNPWAMNFDTFLDHDGSRRARELAKQVASSSTEPINYPIILVGESGSGKSHLLIAIRNYCSTRDPLSRGLYCTGAELKRKYWDYRIAGQLHYFQYELRDRQCILIDNCADLFGDDAVEREIASVLSQCIDSGARIVVSMIPEQRVTGPVTAELKFALGSGTEVEMSIMQRTVLETLISARVEAKVLKCVKESISEQTDRQGWVGLKDSLRSCAIQYE